MQAITIRDLKKTYDNGVEALKGIDLSIEKGDFYALLGPNGAGKSTTIGILTGLVNKTSGTVEVLGHSLDKDPAGLKQCLGVVPQEFNFNIFDNVLNTLIFQAGYYGISAQNAMPNAEKLLKQMDLWEKRDQQNMALSGGMKRRLMVARALVHEPEVLILDEPTAGLDIELRRDLWEFLLDLNKKGTTIILTTHYLEEAEYLCRNIGIIDQGAVLKSAPIKELLQDLDIESYLVDIESSDQKQTPTLPDTEFTLIDPTTLEITLLNGAPIDEAIIALHKQGFKIGSLRNKSNRLEELFLRLTNRKNESA